MSIRWGIISAGLISQDFCTALRSLDHNDHQIVAIAARRLEEAKKFAERFSVTNHYDSYEKVYQDPNVDVVYIGNLNHLHKETCLQAIQYGKNVLCEKPMTLNSAEQEEVLKAAKEKGVFFMEALWTRFFPAMERLRNEISSNNIGQVRYVNANFFVNIRDKERLHSKELGGGGILDIGIYPIQLVCMVFNHEEPLEIKTTGHLMASGVDETASIALKFSNQRMANISVSTNCGPHGSVVVAGENGVLQIPANFWYPTDLILANGERLNFPIENSEGRVTNFGGSVGLRYEAEAVRQALNQGLKEHPLVTHANSRLIMKIMDEARKQIGYH